MLNRPAAAPSSRGAKVALIADCAKKQESQIESDTLPQEDTAALKQELRAAPVFFSVHSAKIRALALGHRQ